MKTIIFKTITLGGKKPSLKGIEVSVWAKELLGKTTYQKKKEEIDLVTLTPQELGFTSYPTTTELFARAKEQGYELCPAEIGPRLREMYKDQPNSEWLWVAHEPITDSDGYPNVFTVERCTDGRLWLNTRWTYPDSQWDLGVRLVFRLRKGTLTSDTQILERNSETLSLELRIEKLERFYERAIELISSLEDVETL